MINWTKYFDAIYLIHYEGQIERKANIYRELDRVGITSHPRFKEMTDYVSPLKYATRYENPQSAAGTLSHYRCWCDMKYHAYDRVLIMEDDIVFLKDINEIERLLEEQPKRYDLCLFDWMITYNQIGGNNRPIEMLEDAKISEHYCYFTSSWLLSCYAISNRMAEYFKKALENNSADPKLHAADHFSQGIAFKHYTYKESYNTIQDFINDLFSDWKTILCTKRIAIQDQYEDCVNYQIGNKEIYNMPLKLPNERDIPVDFNEYNIRKKYNTMEGPQGTENCHV